MSEYDALYAGAPAVEHFRHRSRAFSDHTTPQLTAAAKRDLGTVTHIPGDLSAEEIDRRFAAALKQIRWRRCVESA